MNNKCCNSTTSQGNNNGSVIKTVKTGYLLHFKKRLFGKAWREEFVVLYEDSSLIWFRDRDRNEPEGGIFLKDAPEMLAAGQWTSRVPAHPEFPNGCTFHHAIAVGSRHRRDKVHWFLCKSDSELIDWMSAISHTLPPVPPPPEELRQSRQHLAKVEPNVAAPLTRLPLTPPPQSMSSRQLSSDAGAATSMSLTDKRLAMFKHQPSSPDVLLEKLGRINLDADLTKASSRDHAPYLSEKSRSYSTGKMHHMQTSSEVKPRVTFREDVMAGVMMAGALTQWNAAASNTVPWDWGGAAGMVEPTPWDWGMGWGWAGWTPEGALGGGSAAAFCGSCAMEQHHAAMYASEASHSASYNNLPDSSRHESFHSYDDDHDIGDVGGDADVACDFGGDFGGF